MIKFGFSSREYVLLHEESSKGQELESESESEKEESQVQKEKEAPESTKEKVREIKHF